MDLDEAIRSRRSVRGFLPDAVPENVLHEIFELAQWTPSNCNIQPWVPHVVSGTVLRKLREALVSAAQTSQLPAPDWPTLAKYPGKYRDRQIDAAVQLYGAMSIDRHDTPARFKAYLRNLEFFNAPHVVFIFMHEPFDTREATDIGMYAQKLMLLLTSRGLSSCAQGALSLYPGIVREHLGVPVDQRLLFGVSFGYEDKGEKANMARVGRETLHNAVQFYQ